MRAAGILLPGLVAVATCAAGADAPAPLRFRTQEIDAKLAIGYCVLTPDLNGDGKPDILVVDKEKVVWYENPTWKKRVILDGKSRPDNVSAAVLDVDGDGQLDVVLGAAWRPFDTANPGTLQWLKRGKSLDDEWTMFPIPCDEPTVHRVRAFDIDGDGKPEIVHVPLMGRDATQKGNWLDGRPVRVMAYKVPAEPEKAERWKAEVLFDELHVMHNFTPVPARDGNDILATSYEGVYRLTRGQPKWQATKVGAGNQATPAGSRGASEIKIGKLAGGPVIGTIEPWHGNQVVTYTKGGGELWDRHVVDDKLKWGHGVAFADLDGTPGDELVIGVRDNLSATEKSGVRVYTHGAGGWSRQLVDEGGVAVEDLTTADLDGDGKVDIVACGRATKNVRIYWNQGR
ncbi:MAG: VCBS repeat-containing protein [Gemmataceae bacterium]